MKFDDLCTNFKHHEDLDASNAIITLTKTAEGIISGMDLTAGPNTGVIPVTFPTSKVSEVNKLKRRILTGKHLPASVKSCLWAGSDGGKRGGAPGETS